MEDVGVAQYSHEAPDASLTELSLGEAKLELYAHVVRLYELEVAPSELEWNCMVAIFKRANGEDSGRVKMDERVAISTRFLGASFRRTLPRP
jgi:hypothetical protein